MKLLFIQGGSRIKLSSDGSRYVDGNFNNSVFEDYHCLTEEVYFLLRKDSKNYSDLELKNKFNRLDDCFKIILVPDAYDKISDRFNIDKVSEIKATIKQAVSDCDKIIIRSVGNIYTNTALKYAIKYHKDYLIEVTGFAFEGLWYHSLKGKMVAFQREIKLERALKNAPNALYVTEEALQTRYPCKGKTIGCSDVRIDSFIDVEELAPITNKPIKFTTLAFLDVKWKGQTDVIKAIAILRDKYNIIIDYYLAGSGTGNYLKKVANKLGVAEQIHFVGALEHSKIFEFLKSMDVYIQPSYQEGLCRSIVEAMSMGKPVICSDTGGNYELIDRAFIYKKGNVKQLVELLYKANANREELSKQAHINLEKSKKYSAEILHERRQNFYMEFVKG